MKPAQEVLVLHTENKIGAPWVECFGAPTGDTRCRVFQHITVVPESALRERERETLERAAKVCDGLAQAGHAARTIRALASEEKEP